MTPVPLDALSTGIYPQAAALLADWRSLGEARELKQAWPAFWRVFWATLAEPSTDAPLAIPQRVIQAERPAATAAHPRAFRGTKYQPPKQAVANLDLCAWLADDRLLDGFFARHDFARLPVLGPDGKPLMNVVPTVSGLLAHCAGVEASQLPVLPEAFRRGFLWHLRMRPLRQILAWLKLWREFGGAAHGAALALPASLCALDPLSYSWAEQALNLAPSRQIIFLQAVLRHRAYLLPVRHFTGKQLTALDGLSDDDVRFACYLDAVLANLNRGVRAGFTLCGCELANDDANLEYLNSKLRVTADCAEVPMMDIRRMSAAVGENEKWWQLACWRRCGELPGFAKFLTGTRWEALRAAAAYQWLSLYSGAQSDEPDEKKFRIRWHAYLLSFSAWHALLVSFSGEWQEKCATMLHTLFGKWEKTETLQSSVPHLLPLLARRCAPPFSPGIDGGYTLVNMAGQLRLDGWKQLAAADDHTWLIVERACRRDNDAVLIGRGLHSLAEILPGFLLYSFTNAAKRLMRAARLLGCVEYERRRLFLNEIVRSAWFSLEWSELPPPDAARRLCALCLEAGMDSPLPRRLREHFEGRTMLSGPQIARHCRVTLARLPHVLLGAIEAEIWRRIDAPFNLRDHSRAANHAVRLLAGLDSERKGLRRLLLAYCQGRADTYLDHPLNRAWFARHPRIDAALWNTGVTSNLRYGDREIRIGLETEPLEILMLGTYVGSCLSLGGIGDYSTVACLLDANKQVVYARDANGRVLARQLLAIDEADRLVCFHVYPTTADEVLQQAFAEFDATLAQALGIDLFRSREGETYDVEVLLANDWWDDGAWNRIA